MKYINNKIFIAIALLVSIAGCKKNLEINKNPNSVTESNITAELILPNSLNGVGVQTALGYGWLNNWIGYWSPSGSYAPNTEESTYNLTASFGEGKWDGIYNVLFDLNNVEQRSKPDTSKAYFVGIAKILKAHLFQNLVDIFGNVPYTQAFNSAQNPAPAYDKAQDIYVDLQKQLDSAITILKTKKVPSTAKKIDIVFYGNSTKWIKLANTLKLRILLRQSEVAGFNAAAEIAKIQANGAGFLMSGESAEVNPGTYDESKSPALAPGYVNDIGKQNPYFATYGLQPNGTPANEYYRANNYLINVLKNNNDPRLGYFFAKASALATAPDPYIGTIYGANTDDNYSGTRTSNIGPGLVKSYNQSQWIVTSIESLFLQAEAVARGWISGNDSTAYATAVKESFIWLGIPNAITLAENYLASASNAKWSNAGSTPMEHAKFIVNQKYIALTGINPLEAWNDYRRLGVPSNVPLSVNPARGSRVIPVRLPYPASEFAVNSTNVQAQGNNDYQTTRIFWDVQ